LNLKKSNDDSDLKHLSELIADATRKCVDELFRNGEHFYYVSLTTIYEGFTPVFSAWSWQALDRIASSSTSTDIAETKLLLKWSYADSPYYNHGAEHFIAVEETLSKRAKIDELEDDEWEKELKFRLLAMEQALHQLDSEGIFGQDVLRQKIVINAEVVPPDESNTKRAKRLNPKEALNDWLIEAGE
jgi:hypothetical protein